MQALLIDASPPSDKVNQSLETWQDNMLMNLSTDNILCFHQTVKITRFVLKVCNASFRGVDQHAVIQYQEAELMLTQLLC